MADEESLIQESIEETQPEVETADATPQEDE